MSSEVKQGLLAFAVLCTGFLGYEYVSRRARKIPAPPASSEAMSVVPVPAPAAPLHPCRAADPRVCPKGCYRGPSRCYGPQPGAACRGDIVCREPDYKPYGPTPDPVKQDPNFGR